MLKQDDYIKGRLVEMGWRFTQKYEGGHMAGQMVMHAIANRVRLGWGSWLQVIDSVPTFMAESELPPLKHPSVWEPVFVKLLHAVDGIYDGSAPDLVKGALYWCQLNDIQRSWFKEKIVDALKEPDANGDCLRQHQRLVDMNSLSFFS